VTLQHHNHNSIYSATPISKHYKATTAAQYKQTNFHAWQYNCRQPFLLWNFKH